MFEQLILDALFDGPKGTEKLYALARQRQPADCLAIWNGSTNFGENSRRLSAEG
jgi:hypothetical protein